LQFGLISSAAKFGGGFPAHDAAAEEPLVAFLDVIGIDVISIDVIGIDLVGVGDGSFGNCLFRALPMYDGDRGAADESQDS
jgi:hypothetical protein